MSLYDGVADLRPSINGLFAQYLRYAQKINPPKFGGA
jgi:hypothetical protein